jgi:exodeoxyribonuclease V gamma subunit
MSDACLARLWPDFEALSASGGFEAASEALYAAFKAWLDTAVRVTDHPKEVTP